MNKFNKIIHKGFYANNNQDIISQLHKIKSSNPEITEEGIEVYYDAEYFLHGLCHIFAYALHKKFNYDIYELRSEADSIIHWYCIYEYNGNTVYIDVRGITTNYEEFLSEFKSYNNIKNNKVLNLTEYDYEWKEKKQIEFANEIITKYTDYYAL